MVRGKDLVPLVELLEAAAIDTPGALIDETATGVVVWARQGANDERQHRN